jgi:MSHA pilin protein MshD
MSRRGGFTMIELILIIIVVGIAVPPLIMVFAESMNRRADSDLVGTSAQLGHSLIEEIKTRRWDENTPAGGGRTGTRTPEGDLGPDLGENGRAKYNDVDDYSDINGQSPPEDCLGSPMMEFAGFTQSVAVEYVKPSGTSFVPTSPDGSDYKRVTVSVSSAAGTVEVVTIMTNRH